MSAPEFQFAKPKLPAKKNTIPKPSNQGEPAKTVVNEKPKEPEMKKTNQEAAPVEKPDDNSPAPQDFLRTLKVSNNLLLMVRHLRKLGQEFMDQCMDDQADDSGNRLAVVRNMGMKLEDDLIKMEKLTHHFPESMPKLKMLQMLNIYNEESARTSADYTMRIDNLVNASNWTEGQYQYFYFLSRFLMNPMSFHVKKVCEVRPPLPPLIFTDRSTSEHNKYMEAHAGLKANDYRPEFGFHSNILHETASDSIIEFLIFENINPKLVEHGFISPYTIKITMIEKFGKVKKVVLMSPNQEWTVSNHYYGYPQIDPMMVPKHKVYQMLTKSANTHLAEYYFHVAVWSESRLYHSVSCFAKYRKLLALKCKECNRSLLHFMPPTFLDRHQQTAWHEECRLSSKSSFRCF